MGYAFTVWVHLLGVAVWIGPQIFMFVAAIPAVREIGDRQLRAQVMRVVVTRFGWLAWGAMLLIVLTGISNIFQSEFSKQWDTDFRYIYVFAAKMAILGLTLALTAAHTFIIGPQQMRLAEEPVPDEAAAAKLRRSSMILSSLTLLGSIVVLFFGALLSSGWATYPK